MKKRKLEFQQSSLKLKNVFIYNNVGKPVQALALMNCIYAYFLQS